MFRSIIIFETNVGIRFKARIMNVRNYVRPSTGLGVVATTRNK